MPADPKHPEVDVVVVGAGIVGLATASELQRRLPGRHVVVLDKEPAPALHQTGRNSGVVHSGLYYRPGSAKAQLVARGRKLLQQACDRWEVPIDWCGKVVVATRTAELGRLDDLHERGRENGVRVERISPARLAELEPNVAGLAALHVPGAGIVDYRRVAASLADDIAGAGGEVRLSSQVRTIRPHGRSNSPSGLTLETDSGTVTTSWLVNCAGLQSDRIARMAGATTEVSIVAFRGEYHQLSTARRHLVRHLVYPVPDPRWPFLGVHMTRMTDGSVHVGPNAVLALGREAYDGGIDATDLRDLLRDRGLRRLVASYWATGASELVRSRSTRLLLRDVQRLVPAVTAADLEASSAGIRAQALTAGGQLLDDFAFDSSARAVHVLNAPSPAATASLAIAEVVADRLQTQMAD